MRAAVRCCLAGLPLFFASAGAAAAGGHPYCCLFHYSTHARKSVVTTPDVRELMNKVGLSDLPLPHVGRVDVYNWSTGVCSCCLEQAPTHSADQRRMLSTPRESRKRISFAQLTAGGQNDIFFGTPGGGPWATGIQNGGPYCAPWWALVWMRLMPDRAVAIDIGTHIGDTTVPLAHATRGGDTIGFDAEVHPYNYVRLQAALNPHLRIHPHHVAIGTEDKNVRFRSQQQVTHGEVGEEVRLRRLLPFLQRHHPSLISRISFIKIDAEGQDNNILRAIKDLLDSNRPAMWVEWYGRFKSSPSTTCSAGSAALFATIRDLGYVPYIPCSPIHRRPPNQMPKCAWPPEQVRGCENRHWQADLLLLPKENTPDRWDAEGYVWRKGKQPS
eukprot:TRINITY_DN51752_c0_g1_i1.p1 TRINITY_DN51752_c0_g1~~TRINITY_DN51752_c0_g1_i1.p1  ORF type:complete len:385 (+),score=42.82 TRINITY_DN51752_c0_g1_i1:86-1240(+)